MGKISIRVAAAALVMAMAMAWLAIPAAAQEAARPGVYGEEDRDWGVPPRSQLRTVEYHAPTPVQIPGGRVVATTALSEMMQKEPRPYLIDVLGGGEHRTISGAFWMIGAGAGDMSRDEERRFVEALNKFAAGDKKRPLVFFCVDSQCWLSYNAALRAIAAGYSNVMWYRGGVAAWREAGLGLATSEPFYW
jgi:PQQ-dependent catabolism-associated CXXCW motif protein